MEGTQAPLTRADLDAAVAAIVAHIDKAVAQADTGLRGELAGLESRLHSRIEAAEHATAANLTDLRAELVERLERLERRTERLEINVNAIMAQMAGISKSLTLGEQFDSATAGTLAGIKRTIDELARRIGGLEKAS